LSKWFTGTLLLLEVAMIAVIVTLERLSARNQGIATVPRAAISKPPGTHFSTKTTWSYGLLWTSLPTFLMVLYRLGWEAMVAGTAEREPFIALNRPEKKAAPALKTVMLDYRTYPMLYNWFIAFRRRDGLIGCGMLLSSVLSMGVVPLTSHLLTPAPATRKAVFSTVVSKSFDMNMYGDFNLQPAFSLASSTLGFGAKSPPWTTPKYAFEPFYFKTLAGSRNYTAPTNAFFGQLDCRIVDAQPRPSRSTLAANMTQVNFDVKDRDCPTPYLSMFITDKPIAKVLTMSTANTNCGETAHFSRVATVMGNPITPEIIAKSYGSLLHPVVLETGSNLNCRSK
jgi:hypothetical protein